MRAPQDDAQAPEGAELTTPAGGERNAAAVLPTVLTLLCQRAAGSALDPRLFLRLQATSRELRATLASAAVGLLSVDVSPPGAPLGLEAPPAATAAYWASLRTWLAQHALLVGELRVRATAAGELARALEEAVGGDPRRLQHVAALTVAAAKEPVAPTSSPSMLGAVKLVGLAEARCDALGPLLAQLPAARLTRLDTGLVPAALPALAGLTAIERATLRGDAGAMDGEGEADAARGLAEALAVPRPGLTRLELRGVPLRRQELIDSVAQGAPGLRELWLSDTRRWSAVPGTAAAVAALDFTPLAALRGFGLAALALTAEGPALPAQVERLSLSVVRPHGLTALHGPTALSRLHLAAAAWMQPQDAAELHAALPQLAGVSLSYTDAAQLSPEEGDGGGGGQALRASVRAQGMPLSAWALLPLMELRLCVSDPANNALSLPTLSALPQLKHLTSLSLAGRPERLAMLHVYVEATPSQAGALLAQLSSVRSLSLDHVFFPPRPGVPFGGGRHAAPQVLDLYKSIAGLPRLRRLSVRETLPGPDDTAVLAALAACSTLTALELTPLLGIMATGRDAAQAAAAMQRLLHHPIVARLCAAAAWLAARLPGWLPGWLHSCVAGPQALVDRMDAVAVLAPKLNAFQG